MNYDVTLLLYNLLPTFAANVLRPQQYYMSIKNVITDVKINDGINRKFSKFYSNEETATA